jgi:hypothetical protein
MTGIPIALVAIIELARTETRNPEIPQWSEKDYFRAIEELFWRIAGHSVNSLNARFQQDVYQQVSHSLCHCHSFPAPPAALPSQILQRF